MINQRQEHPRNITVKDRAMKGGINQHKEMAMGGDGSGSFGVKKMPQREATHPDVNMKHEPMADSFRSPAHKGMQGAPDHGPMGNDHFVRAGKA